MQKHHVCQLYEFCLLNFHLTFFRRYSNVKWANIYRFRIHWILYSLLRGSLHKLKIIHELGYCIFARLNAKFWLPKHSLENRNHCDDSSEIAFEKRTDISIELLDSCMVSCQLSRNVFSFLGIQQINFYANSCSPFLFNNTEANLLYLRLYLSETNVKRFVFRLHDIAVFSTVNAFGTFSNEKKTWNLKCRQ